MIVDFGRDVTGRLAAAESKEWLCPNGIGGFASETVAGLLTRRYHGLLVAALAPPVGRTLLVSKAGRARPLRGTRPSALHEPVGRRWHHRSGRPS